MSIADRPRQCGYTMLEIVVVVAMISLLALAAERTLKAMQDTEDNLQATRRVERRGEELAYEVRNQVSSSRKLFYRGSIGDSYLHVLGITRFPPAPGTRLPLPEEATPLGPDLPGVPRTSDMLLFAREADPFVCSADPAQGKVRYIDVYRFVCIYPTEDASQRVLTRDAKPPRDLVIWTSIGYPSYAEVMAIQDPVERATVVKHLYLDYGCNHLWNTEALASEGFFAIDGSGAISATADPGVVVAEDVVRSPGPRLLRAHVQLARTDPGSAVRRAVMTRDDPNSWAPDGFEVKIGGSSSQRQVWLRLTVESQSRTTSEVVHAVTLIATTRDF
jgi:prepilin-type N-terminal cleavage/methylation domain-containing protein